MLKGIIILIVFFVIAVVCVGFLNAGFMSKKQRAIGIAVSAVIVLALTYGGWWFFTQTATGSRALVDFRSDVNNGLERTVTVYTANGEIIAQYTGRIDIEGNDGGYVLFDYEGKRYTYYNCFVESIAELPD